MVKSEFWNTNKMDKSAERLNKKRKIADKHCGTAKGDTPTDINEIKITTRKYCGQFYANTFEKCILY